MKKRRGKGVTINIHLTNHWLYTLIAIVILVAVAVGIYAYGTWNPSTFGHSLGEIANCGANQTLKMNAAGTAWTCSSIPLDCQRVESSITTNPLVWCPTGYISTGGGVSCQSWLDRVGSSQPFLSISPTASGWTGSCFQGTTNNPSNGRAYAICCR